LGNLGYCGDVKQMRKEDQTEQILKAKRKKKCLDCGREFTTEKGMPEFFCSWECKELFHI